jgi:small-conductance mechanosensitive channel
LKYSESVKKLAPALLAVQGKIRNMKKEAINEELNTMYVDLPTVLKFVRPILQSEDIVLIQGTEKVGDEDGIVTRLMHKSGEYVESLTSTKMVDVNNSFEELQLDKTNYLQKYGGQITYMRRYAIFTLLGIGTEDNDGNEPKNVTQADMAEEFREKAVKASKKGTIKPEKTITLAQRIEELPKDLKEILERVGAKTAVQKLTIMRVAKWDIRTATKECLRRLRVAKPSGPRGPHKGLETMTAAEGAKLDKIADKHRKIIQRKGTKANG